MTWNFIKKPLEWRKNMKLYLKKPSAEEEQEWKNYIKEFRKIDINATPLGYYENIDYKDWLIKIENERLRNLPNIQVSNTMN